MPRLPIKAVVFDMDGILVASEDYWFQSRIDYLATLGKVWTMDDQHVAMGRNTIEWAQVMKERMQLDQSLETIMDEVKSRVIARMEARLPVLPGALEAVHTAASRYRVALASGSPTEVIKRVVSLMKLDTVFETMVYGDDLPHGKPAPDIYFETARRLGLQPQEFIGVEDSPNGIHALHNADMGIIAVPSPGFTLPTDVAALADITLSSLEGFSLDAIEQLNRLAVRYR